MKHYFDILYPDGSFCSNIVQYLEDNAKNPYKDLDSINKYSKDSAYVCEEFYTDLRKYLSEKAKSYNKDVSFEMDKENNVLGIIFTNKKDGFCFPLKSDQLAFSFFGKTSKDNKHPYGILYNSIKGFNSAKKIEEYSFIAECLNDTRTLGASFLWPMVCNENGIWNTNPKYNMYRGIRSYIEDRVDLTLWEIKEAYDYLLNKTKYKGNILIDEISKNSNMKKWLELFESFEGYVDFFTFNPCVVDINHEYIPIDIVSSDVKLKVIKEITHEHVKELRSINKKEIQSLKSSEDIKRVLENVRLLTLHRSQLMHNNIVD